MPDASDSLSADTDQIERGFRFGHIMMMVGQVQGNEAMAAVMALVDLLVAKGEITGEEFETYRKRAQEQIKNISQPRVRLATLGDKYSDAETAEIDCASRIHLCQARCCSFNFYLSVQDVEEGAAKWDFGNPYWIKHEADGYCTHCDPATRACTIHAQRPHVCRLYDCRNDKRVWIDFEARIPAPMTTPMKPLPVAFAEPALANDLLPNGASSGTPSE